MIKISEITEIDDSNWSIKDIAGLYKAAAKFVGYSKDEVEKFFEIADRQKMLVNLDHFRKDGWICVSEGQSFGSLKKIDFSSLAELSLKLTVMGILV